MGVPALDCRIYGDRNPVCGSLCDVDGVCGRGSFRNCGFETWSAGNSVQCGGAFAPVPSVCSGVDVLSKRYLCVEFREGWREAFGVWKWDSQVFSSGSADLSADGAWYLGREQPESVAYETSSSYLVIFRAAEENITAKID